MTTSAEAVYLDSSALVKIVIREAESADLLRFLADRPVRVSAALARVELIRATRPHGSDAIARARRILAGLHLIRLDDELLEAAAALDPVILRSLDAIHLAAARALGGTLRELITYDERMAQAAKLIGCVVATPGRP